MDEDEGWIDDDIHHGEEEGESEESDEWVDEDEDEDKSESGTDRGEVEIRKRGTRRNNGRWMKGKGSPEKGEEAQGEKAEEKIEGTVTVEYTVHREGAEGGEKRSLEVGDNERVSEMVRRVREEFGGSCSFFLDDINMKIVHDTQVSHISQYLSQILDADASHVFYQDTYYLTRKTPISFIHSKRIDVIIESKMIQHQHQTYDTKHYKQCDNKCVRFSVNQGIRLRAIGVIPFTSELRRSLSIYTTNRRDHSVCEVDISFCEPGLDTMVYLADSLRVEAGDIVSICIQTEPSDRGALCKTSNSQRVSCGSDGSLFSFYPVDSVPISAVYYDS